MHNETFRATGDRATALRRHAGCGEAREGHRGEFCAAVDELIAFAPRHFADAAIKYIV